MDNELIYTSKSLPRSLWQQYKIYPNRIELQCRMLFTTLIIRAEDLIAINICEPGWDLSKIWVLNLDWSPFYRHIFIERKPKLWGRYFRITPNNPDEFLEIASKTYGL